MTKYHGKNSRLYVNGYDISSLMAGVTPVQESEMAQYAVADGVAGYHYLRGLGKDIMSLDAIFDDNYQTVLNNLFASTSAYQIVIPFGTTIEDRALAVDGAFLEKYTWKAVVSDINRLIAEFKAENYPWDECKLAFPKATKTSDGNHTSMDGSADLVHEEKDTTNPVSSANASNQATLETLLNEIKADYNAHRVSTTFHVAADSTNVVASANASDLATALTLANEIKADYNAHRVLTGVHVNNDPVNKIVSVDATDLATCITLANEIKADYNTHLNVWYNGLIAYLQVFACGSDDALIVKIQESSDDGSSDAWADILTFTTANGITTERKTQSGAIERYLRVIWSGTPTYSASFAVVFKRG